jgi:hypothetical protein
VDLRLSKRAPFVFHDPLRWCVLSRPRRTKLSEPWLDDMSLKIESHHALSPNELDAIEGHLYRHNSHATGRHDGEGLGFVIRDELGRMIGVAAGYTWAGISELRQMGR